ncbi:MAG TPA: M23 family metallopeptidase [Bacillota bacterium]|nr:peptidoglycan DD-metalloendopeptidase family protein [Candidatus Fermentithermobacillaceae bacterium]HOB30752.1 M23 family metallopeptidase [Bacillota bacterium]HOK64873.1 M23 family metallopeptidase [Bacillota bacterium]HOL12584.1 M23 family metallopeptidase [Bacillota bacterium]HOQ03306.1 M23 family metallopeptidase [Bacillota bacterium]
MSTTNNRVQRPKKPHSSRERRFSFLVVYSHGKTRTFSLSLNTLIAGLCCICVALTGLGLFVNSYKEVKEENQELSYLYEVADSQQKKIEEIQTLLAEVSERLAQAELVESQAISMLQQEGLIQPIQKADEDPEPVPRADQVVAAVASRSGFNRRTPIPLQGVLPVLGALEQSANQLAEQVGDLEEQVEVLEEKATEVVSYARSVPNIWPVNGRVTSGYGWRKHPISRRTHFHTGVDIPASYGTPVKAAAYGTVTFVGYKIGYGRTVMVNHGYGFQTMYSHLSSTKVSVGQKVQRGDVIGNVGTSGTTTGPHLHYEVHKNGATQNPMDFLPR